MNIGTRFYHRPDQLLHAHYHAILILKSQTDNLISITTETSSRSTSSKKTEFSQIGIRVHHRYWVSPSKKITAVPRNRHYSNSTLN
jgi:hypothetical protein